MKTFPTLNDFINGPVILGDPILSSLLIQAENQKHSALFTCNFVSRQIIYISAKCKDLVGYPVDRFIHGGAEFFFQIADPEVIPTIIQQQLSYTQRSKEPGFNPKNCYHPAISGDDDYRGWPKEKNTFACCSTDLRANR
ncbi:hypothetical protein QQ054_29450 [Oscillatoria amoena NRMC-F 0135]|nr:hypothetical protein [Oscillatoria amoena NRMC-F 0135]